jgi:simple sugar transport system permease protein
LRWWCNGVTRLVTNQVLVSGIDKAAGYDTARLIFDTEFQLLGATFRTSMIWWIVITLIATRLLMRTKYGNWIFAVGGDANAARSVGVPSNRVKIGLFMTTSLAAWLVGMIYIVRLRSAVASQGLTGICLYHLSCD